MASIRDLILNVVEKKEGNALTAAANDIEKLGRGVDATGGSMKGFTKDAEKLNAEIEKSTARVKDLHKQFAASGDKSLFGDIRKEEQNIKNLRKTLQVLADDAHDAGKQAGQSLFGGIASGFQGAAGTPVLGPILGGAIIGAVAGLAPALGAIVAGAVSGIGAVGGVAGGVLSAIKDPVVKSAFSEFGDDISRDFFKGSAFIEPIRKSLAVLERDFAGLNLDTAFAKVAPDVQILAQGIGALVRNIMPGFNALLDRSGPIVNELAVGLGRVGVGISDFIDDVSSSRGTLDGLETAFALITATLQGTGNAIHWLSDVYHDFIELNEKLFRATATVADTLGRHGVADDARKVADLMKDLLTHTDGTAESIKGLGDAFRGTNNQIEAANRQLAAFLQTEEDLIGNNLSLDAANIKVAQDFADLNDKLVKGKGNWDLNTQAGRDNRDMLRGVIEDLDRQRLAAIKNSDGTVGAINTINAAYDTQLAQLLKVAQAAGDSKAQLEALAKKYYLDVIVSVQELGIRNQQVKAKAIDQALGNLIGSYASGGTVPGPVGVPQLAVVHGGERVLTPPQAKAIGGDGAAQPVVISFVPPAGGSPLDQMFFSWVSKYVRVNGGNVQTVLGGG